MQKLQSWWKVLAFGVVAAAFGLMTASCTPTEDDADEYTVTLKGDLEDSFVALFSMGIDDPEDVDVKAKFKEGDTVIVFAGYDPNFEKEFDRWTVPSGVVPLFPAYYGYDSEVFVFVMPGKNVTLTANWSDGPVGPTGFQVSLIAGELSTGEGFYPVGSTVTIFAGTKYGKVFAGWESDDVDVEDDPYYTTFVMPNYPVTITALWADAGDANVRFTWEREWENKVDVDDDGEDVFVAKILSIAANDEDVADWYDLFTSPDYIGEDATDYPYFVGNRDVPINVYSETLHSETGSPNKGKYFETYEGNYTAVCTGEDRFGIFDIVANYTLDVTGASGKEFFEIAFDVGTYIIDGVEGQAWFRDEFEDETDGPRLEKKKAAKLLKKVKKGNVTYYIFRRAAKK